MKSFLKFSFAASTVVIILLCVFLFTPTHKIFAAQNPDIKVGANMYNLGFGSAPQTCFDGTQDIKNGCVSKWIASNLYVSNSANSITCPAGAPTICIGGGYPGSLPSLMDMYWIRDAVGANQYEKSLLHFAQDTGFIHGSGLIGMDQFDFFNQTNGLTEGISYYKPSQAVNGALLYNGSTFVSDITQWVYGGAVTSVSYSGGTFTLTGIASENFTNITQGNTITLAGFTSATFLNGKTVTVSSSSGTSTPVMTFSLTCSSNCNGSSETGYLANAQSIPTGDTLYIADMEPFDQINVRIATPQIGGSVTYQYSKGNGVWGDLTIASHWHDGTNGLTSGLGSSQISFYPPSDWAMDSLNGSKMKFWVRVKPTSATQQPTIFNLRGDNLHSTLVSSSQCGSVTGCLIRGWSKSAYLASTACNGSPCVVAGNYIYNPNPPSSSSARFLYQARTGGYGGYGNDVWLNPSATDSGGNTLAGEMMPYLWTAAVTAQVGRDLSHINGSILDNAASRIGMYPIWNPDLTDLACSSSFGGSGCSEVNGNSNFDNYWATAFAQSTALFHATYGSSFVTTGNITQNWPSTLSTIGPSFNLFWLENPLLVIAAGNFNGSTTNPQDTFDLGFHGMIPAIAEIDSFKDGFCDQNYSPCIPFVWNRGARGSMNALGNQYLFGNPNTVLTYSITGMSIYNMGDQYWYFTNATTLTGRISRGVYPTTYTFSVASTSSLLPMGYSGCQQPGCGGTDNPYAGNTFVRICPTPTTCQDGDVFRVTTQGQTSVSIIANVGSNTAIANSYTGNETVQVVQYGHQAYTLPANMPSWKDVMAYATAAPAFHVDIGVPNTTSGWQPPSGNCGSQSCSKGDRDMFYGTSCTTLHCSAQQYSALPCVNGTYNSPLAGGSRDCSPLARRDYTNAIVLMRTARTGGTLPTAPEEWTTYSKPINLSSFESRCAPNCVYYRLEADGTTDPGVGTITIRGSETAILMKNPLGGGGGGGGTPTTPTGLAGTATSPTSVSLSWNASTEQGGTGSIAGYDIYRNGTSIATSSTTTYIDNTVTGGNTYTYTVDAYDTNGNHSAQSSPIQVTTPGGGGGTPSIPTGLAGTATSQSSVSLTWNASTEQGGTGSIAGYDIYRNNTKVGTSTTLAYSDTGLSANTTYTYAVDAYDTNGNHSLKSTPIQVTTQSGNYTGPTTPTGLAGTATSPTSVSLTWNASTEIGVGGIGIKVVGYDIYRNGTAIGTSTTLTYTDSTVVANTTYTYTVDAFDNAVPAKHSAQSTPVSVTTPQTGSGTPSIPTNLAGTATSPTSVSLSWNASTEQGGTGSIAGYEVYRDGTAIGTSTTLTYTDSTVVANTTYSYAVDAYDTNNNHSLKSTPVSVTTPQGQGQGGSPTTPTNLAGVATSQTSISLSWTASTETGGTIAGYDIYRDGTSIGTSTVPTYTDNTVTANTTYTYTVDAYDSASPPQHSSQSTPVQVTTPQTGSGTPTTPTNLIGTAISSSEVDLSWTASTESGGTGSIAGYEVYRNGFAVGTSTDTTYVDNTVAANTTYSYSVDAYDTTGTHSPKSSQVQVTTPQDNNNNGGDIRYGSNILTDGTIYFLDHNGYRRPYTNAGDFLSFGFNSFSSVLSPNQDEQNLPTGRFVTPMDGSLINDHGTVYIVSRGTKAGFTTPSVFLSFGYKWGSVVKGDVSFMDMGPILDSPQRAHLAGTLVLDHGTVYLLAEDGKMGIPSLDVFNSWGYNFSEVVQANSFDQALPMSKGVMQVRGVTLSPL